MVQTEAYAFRPVPLQGIEEITDRVVAVFIGNNRNCVYDLLLHCQPIVFFKVQEQIFHIYISQCRAVTIPAQRLYNVNPSVKQIFSDSTL